MSSATSSAAAVRKGGRTRTTRTPIPPKRSGIPADVTYSIIKDERMDRIKRCLDVRLSRKVSKDVLQNIALELKDSAGVSFQRTFICYYLPGMKVGEGAWAITHFNPTLEVSILGPTVEDDRRAARLKWPVEGTLLGRWLDPRLGGMAR